MNEYLNEMGTILSRYNAMSVGECPHTPDLSTVVGYVGASQKRLNMVFQFDVVDLGKGAAFRYQATPFAYKLRDLKAAVLNTQSFLSGTDGWATTFVENHDQARSISRFGDDSPKWRERSGKMLAMLFASLSGTLFVYQGQEIGMINAPKEWPIEEYKDVDSINYYRLMSERYPKDPSELSKVHNALQHLARDHARTPMQWTSAANGGFTSDDVDPWMRVNPSTSKINVEDQVQREDSVLAFWKQLLQLRSQYGNVLVDGEFELIDEANEKVFTFLKRGKFKQAIVVCNFSGSSNKVPQAALQQKGTLLLSNVERRSENVLDPWEGRLYLVG